MGYFGPKATTGLSQALIALMPPHDYVDSVNRHRNLTPQNHATSMGWHAYRRRIAAPNNSHWPFERDAARRRTAAFAGQHELKLVFLAVEFSSSRPQRTCNIERAVMDIPEQCRHQREKSLRLVHPVQA